MTLRGEPAPASLPLAASVTSLRRRRWTSPDDDHAALHDPADAADDDVDIRERVALDRRQIGVVSGRYRAELVPPSEERRIQQKHRPNDTRT